MTKGGLRPAASTSSIFYWQTYGPVVALPHWPEQHSEKAPHVAPGAPHPFAEQMRASPSGTQKPEQQSVPLSHAPAAATQEPVPPFPPA